MNKKTPIGKPRNLGGKRPSNANKTFAKQGAKGGKPSADNKPRGAGLFGKNKRQAARSGAAPQAERASFAGERPQREFSAERPHFKDGNGKRFEEGKRPAGRKPRRAFGDNRFEEKPRREFSGERPRFGQDSTESNAPRGTGLFGKNKRLAAKGRPAAEFGDKRFEDKPRRRFEGEQLSRRDVDGNRFEDRPRRAFDDSRFEDRPRRAFDDSRFEDRPRRAFSGERPNRDRSAQAMGANRFADRPRRDVDGNRFEGEQRPRRAFAENRFEDRPRRAFGGERPNREFSGNRFDAAKPRREFNGERKPRHQFDGERPRREFSAAVAAIDWREPLNARQAAAQTLYAVIFEQQSLSGLLEDTKAQVREPDQALYQALVYGSLREYPALSKLRDSFLQEPPSAEQAYLGIILNLGIYQLLRLSLGDHGVLNETVDLAKYFGIGNATGLINAILRRVQREREGSRHLLEKYRIYNVPAWVATAQRQAIAALADVNRLQPPLTLRIRENREDWLAQHGELGVANPLHSQAVTLNSGMNVQEIPGFNEGQVSVQDASAQCAATLLAPKNGERILDACAAPGGKTGHLLELAPQAEVLAVDLVDKRLAKVADNLQRLGLSAQCLAADVGELNTWWQGEAFDAVLLDAPCSGSGVLRRHPDIAFVRSADDLKQLPKTQMRLLRQLWQTLKPNGRLLYTTCSILPRENQQLIEQFLMLEPQARLQALDLPHCQDTGFGYLHLPDADGDGFFYALLHKASV